LAVAGGVVTAGWLAAVAATAAAGRAALPRAATRVNTRFASPLEAAAAVTAVAAEAPAAALPTAVAANNPINKLDKIFDFVFITVIPSYDNTLGREDLDEIYFR
jgi:hypothetical protein